MRSVALPSLLALGSTLALLGCAGAGSTSGTADDVTGSEFGSQAGGVASGATGPGPGGAGAPVANPDPWPRSFQLVDAQATVYQPQVESWQGNQLGFRCAVGVTPQGDSAKSFGVIWGTARTQVNRE